MCVFVTLQRCVGRRISVFCDVEEQNGIYQNKINNLSVNERIRPIFVTLMFMCFFTRACQSSLSVHSNPHDSMLFH